MAISTRMSRNPVTPSAQSPSIGARPSSSRPSSVKNSMAASMSSTTMPTLSMRFTVMMSPWRLTCRAAARRLQRGGCCGWLDLDDLDITRLIEVPCSRELYDFTNRLAWVRCGRDVPVAITCQANDQFVHDLLPQLAVSADGAEQHHLASD